MVTLVADCLDQCKLFDALLSCSSFGDSWSLHLLFSLPGYCVACLHRHHPVPPTWWLHLLAQSNASCASQIALYYSLVLLLLLSSFFFHLKTELNRWLLSVLSVLLPSLLSYAAFWLRWPERLYYFCWVSKTAFSLVFCGHLQIFLFALKSKNHFLFHLNFVHLNNLTSLVN